MRVSAIKIVNQPDYCQLQAQIDMDALGKKSFLLWYRFPPEYESFMNASCGDPFLASVLLPAMVTGEVLDVEAPVSPKLFNTLSTIQDIYHCWDRNLTKVSVNAPERLLVNNRVKPVQAASFFSGGVDSFYTLLKHSQGSNKTHLTSYILTHLIVLRGFDMPIDKEYNDLFEEALSNVQNVARAMGKKLLLISTNVRELLDLFVDGKLFGHGAALATVALTLQNLFTTIYIPSSNSYAALHPWGSHPLLDPLWSTEELAVIHNGSEANRLDKVRFIAPLAIVAKSLRICAAINSDAPKALLNCRKCEKCLRTMIGLHISGALEKSEVLPRSIDSSVVRNLSIHEGISHSYRSLYHALGNSEKDQEIKRAIAVAMEKGKFDIGQSDQNKNVEPTYFGYRLHALNTALSTIFSGIETIILVDEDQLRRSIENVRQIIPFLERQKKYWGPPPDDKTAIEAVEYLRKEGAGFMVIAWPAFWWLEYYKEFTQYLRFNFTCILENDHLIVFNLKKQ